MWFVSRFCSCGRRKTRVTRQTQARERTRGATLISKHPHTPPPLPVLLKNTQMASSKFTPHPCHPAFHPPTFFHQHPAPCTCPPIRSSWDAPEARHTLTPLAQVPAAGIWGREGLQGDMPFSTGPLILFVKFNTVVLHIRSIFVKCMSEYDWETECVVVWLSYLRVCVLESGVINSKSPS